MTRTILFPIAATLLFAATSVAQEPGGAGGPRGGFGGPGGRGGMIRFSPILSALDADNDGVISAAELANAPAALKTLDKNGDGQLTEDELRPQFGGRGGQGGNGGFAGHNSFTWNGPRPMLAPPAAQGWNHTGTNGGLSGAPAQVNGPGNTKFCITHVLHLLGVGSRGPCSNGACHFSHVSIPPTCPQTLRDRLGSLPIRDAMLRTSFLQAVAQLP